MPIKQDSAVVLLRVMVKVLVEERVPPAPRPVEAVMVLLAALAT